MGLPGTEHFEKTFNKLDGIKQILSEIANQDELLLETPSVSKVLNTELSAHERNLVVEIALESVRNCRELSGYDEEELRKVLDRGIAVLDPGSNLSLPPAAKQNLTVH